MATELENIQNMWHGKQGCLELISYFRYLEGSEVQSFSTTNRCHYNEVCKDVGKFFPVAKKSLRIQDVSVLRPDFQVYNDHFTCRGAFIPFLSFQMKLILKTLVNSLHQANNELASPQCRKWHIDSEESRDNVGAFSNWHFRFLLIQMPISLK